MLDQKIPREVRNLAWKFSKEIKDLPICEVWAVSVKQTWPASRSSLGVGRNEYRVHSKQHQVQFKKAPPQIFRRTLSYKKNPVFTTVLRTWCFMWILRRLLRLFFQFSFQVNFKTLHWTVKMFCKRTFDRDCWCERCETTILIDCDEDVLEDELDFPCLKIL